MFEGDYMPQHGAHDDLKIVDKTDKPYGPTYRDKLISRMRTLAKRIKRHDYRYDYKNLMEVIKSTHPNAEEAEALKNVGIGIFNPDDIDELRAIVRRIGGTPQMVEEERVRVHNGALAVKMIIIDKGTKDWIHHAKNDGVMIPKKRHYDDPLDDDDVVYGGSDE